MDRQKMLLGALSAVVVLAILVFVYQYQDNKSADTMMPKLKQAEAPKPIPTTVDGIADEIESEAALDEAALEAEVTAETAEVKVDSQTLNNLSESYDENSL
ncbi:MAG: hypothetical protein AAB845_01980 [Patescibacteria group bacterium]